MNCPAGINKVFLNLNLNLKEGMKYMNHVFFPTCCVLFIKYDVGIKDPFKRAGSLALCSSIFSCEFAG